VPCGFTGGPATPELADHGASEGGLPIGLQLTGRQFDEATVLRIADAYQRDTEWSTQTPPIATR
jgi:aspartyl-tRNA(Asn)/glutamyl-tRNA(Gln) amidotransferase subunit A